MLEIKNILYPTDFSDFSYHALPWALDLTDRYHARLHCIHVVDQAIQYFASAGENVVPAVIPYEELLQSARRQMQSLIDQRIPDRTDSLVTHVTLGPPFLEIIRYAREQNIDLIVLATHGRSALASMFLGSTAEKIIRKSPCPVLTVKHPQHEFHLP